MADDRHEAYRAMFTRQKIGEVLEQMDLQDQKSFMYDCIEYAIKKDDRTFLTVRQVIEEVYQKQKNYERID